MNKRNTLLIIMGVILIAFIVSISLTNFNLSAVATDSGFDTSYDGGDGEGDIGEIIYLIYLFIEYPIPTTIFIVILLISAVKSREQNRKYDNNLNYQKEYNFIEPTSIKQEPSNNKNITNSYSYLKIYDRKLEPYILKDNIVILHKKEEVNTTDFVAYNERGLIKIKQVKEINDDTLKLNYINYKEEIIINKSEILGTVTFNSNIFSRIIRILTKPAMILVMLIYLYYSSMWAFKR